MTIPGKTINNFLKRNDSSRGKKTMDAGFRNVYRAFLLGEAWVASRAMNAFGLASPMEGGNGMRRCEGTSADSCRRRWTR
jgi:hypothetical protein